MVLCTIEVFEIILDLGSRKLMQGIFGHVIAILYWVFAFFIECLFLYGYLKIGPAQEEFEEASDQDVMLYQSKEILSEKESLSEAKGRTQQGSESEKEDDSISILNPAIGSEALVKKIMTEDFTMNTQFSTKITVHEVEKDGDETELVIRTRIQPIKTSVKRGLYQ